MTFKIKILSFHKIVKIIFLSIILLISVKFFQLNAIEVLFFQIHGVYLFLVLFFLIVYVFILNINEHFSKVIVYFFVLMVVVPFYSAYRAKVSFDQPFIYGLLSQRNWLIIGTSIIIYYYLTTQQNYIKVIESTFSFFYKLTIDPNNLDDKQNFQPYFITFGTIYYFIKYMKIKISHNLIILMFFIAYTIFVIQGRTYTLAIIFTFIIYFLRNFNPSTLFVKSMKISAGLILIFFLLQIINPNFVTQTKTLYIQMFTVLTGQMSNDPSANSRLIQLATVIEYFQDNLLAIIFGAGKLSNQWQGGFESHFGHFYPSDIGIIGAWFLYGFVGIILIVFIPVIISFKAAFYKFSNANIFILSIQYFLIYLIIKSVQGSFFINPAQYTIPLFILIGFNKIQSLQHEN